ncbi:MAG: T9SS type A sorting domain-containing protein [Dysgonomonas sp.]
MRNRFLFYFLLSFVIFPLQAQVSMPSANKPLAPLLKQRKLDKKIQRQQKEAQYRTDSIVSRINATLPETRLNDIIKSRMINGTARANVKKSKLKTSSETTATTSLLDSVVTVDGSGNYIDKILYSYNEKGKELTMLYMVWSSAGQAWINSEKGTYSYDDAGNYKDFLYQVWNSLSGKWVNDYKLDYVCDNYGRITSSITSYWSIVNQGWIYDERQLVEYFGTDPDSQLYTFAQLDYWDIASNSWTGNLPDNKIYDPYKYSATFDDQARSTGVVSYQWVNSNSEWVYSRVSHLGYDNAGHQVSNVDSIWNKSTSSWVANSKWERVYDNAENVIYAVYYEGWNSETSDWIGDMKKVDAYDSENRQVLSEFYSWDSDLGWVGDAKYEYAYDSYGNQILDASYYEWDRENLSWIGNSKSVNAYDSQKRTTLSEQYEWNEGWSGLEKHEYAYDTYGNKIVDASYYEWDSEKSAWIGDLKLEYEYDEAENLTMYASYTWDNDKMIWIGGGKQIFGFDDANREILYIPYDWDFDKDEWLPLDKSEKLYDEYGNEILDADYTWDSATSTWIGQSKYVNRYDEYGNTLLSEAYSGWNRTTNSWIGRRKSEYFFDAYGVQLMGASYTWSTITNDWYGSNKETWTYNEKREIEDHKYYEWSGTTNDWVVSMVVAYYYSDHIISSINVSVENKLVAYPNPTATVLNINGLVGEAALEVTDMGGKVVMSITNFAGSADITSLAGGVYLAHIKNSDVDAIVKFVKSDF